jgi:hypothetical protein
MRDDIQHILSGKSQVKHHHLIQTTCSYLKGSQGASSMAKDQQQHKDEETKSLIQFAEKNHLWVDIDIDLYVSQGAEQKVYLKNGLTVLKLNDAIYYASWVDYFHNLLLNNLFFPDTAYQLLGFYKDSSILYAVVEQPFVKANEKTDLNMVKAFLENNGFINKKNHDYYNEELGLILEDLHDENVLTQNGMLYFIDTVFYIVNHKK